MEECFIWFFLLLVDGVELASYLVMKGFRINRVVSRHYFFEDLITVEAVYVS